MKDIKRQKSREAAFLKLEALTAGGRDVSAHLLTQCFAHPFRWVRSEAICRVSDYRRADLTWLFAVMLNDNYDGVVEDAARALALINSDEALEILSDAFFEGQIERPHHLANAISQFGERGFDVLLKGTENASPNIRYYSARSLGNTGIEAARIVLETMAENDHEKTGFGGLVSTAARKGLKTLSKNSIIKSNEKCG